MSQDLTSMIEEINSVSATLSKTNKPDNPVSVLRANSKISCPSKAMLNLIANYTNVVFLFSLNSSRKLSECLMGIYRFCSRSMKALQACSQRSRRRRRKVRGSGRTGIMALAATRLMISTDHLLAVEDDKSCVVSKQKRVFAWDMDCTDKLIHLLLEW